LNLVFPGVLLFGLEIAIVGGYERAENLRRIR
jgi:hypothetical protein